MFLLVVLALDESRLVTVYGNFWLAQQYLGQSWWNAEAISLWCRPKGGVRLNFSLLINKINYGNENAVSALKETFALYWSECTYFHCWNKKCSHLFCWCEDSCEVPQMGRAVTENSSHGSVGLVPSLTGNSVNFCKSAIRK